METLRNDSHYTRRPTSRELAFSSQKVNRTTPYTSASEAVHYNSMSSASASHPRSRRASVSGEIQDVKGVVEGREKNKRDMRELNERLAAHIEKSRYWQAQNRKLRGELDGLKNRWGKETEKVRQMYDTELKQLRRLLDDAERKEGEKDAKIASLEAVNKDLQLQCNTVNAHIDKLDETIDHQNQSIADKDGEISLLKRRIAQLQEQRAKDKKNINRLKDENTRLQTDLDKEMSGRIGAENECQTLKDELEFIKRVHEQELKELRTLVRKDDHDENREFWKHELGQAIYEIQQEYDTQLDTVRNEIETMYTSKLKEMSRTVPQNSSETVYMREENMKLKDVHNDLRKKLSVLQTRYDDLEKEMNDHKGDWDAERRRLQEDRDQLEKDLLRSDGDLQKVLSELQNLMDSKLSLQLEIAAYRKLLEAEDNEHSRNRPANQTNTEITTALRSFANERSPPPQRANIPSKPEVNDAPRNRSSLAAPNRPNSVVQNKESEKPILNKADSRGQMLANTNYEKLYKGNVCIEDCDLEGKFVTLENVSNQREVLEGWKIVRTIDDGRQVLRFTFPTFELGPRKSVKIWAFGKRPFGSNDLEANFASWGVGVNVRTILYSADDKERATHSQRTVFSSET